jgi:hypothetical protein
MLKKLHKILSVLFSYSVQLLTLVNALREFVIFYIFKLLRMRLGTFLGYRVGWVFYPKTTVWNMFTVYLWKFLSFVFFLRIFFRHPVRNLFSKLRFAYSSVILYLDWFFLILVWPKWFRFTSFFYPLFVDTTIEVIYYFFPQEKYNSALTAEEEEQLFLQTSSQKKKLMLDSTLFDIKTGVSLPWLLKKSLRFFSLKSLSNEQKKSFSRVVKLNSPLLTQTGFFKNQNLILRLSKKFSHVNRRFYVLQELFANWWPTTTIFKQTGSGFFKSVSSVYHPPLPPNFKLPTKWFDFSFLFEVFCLAFFSSLRFWSFLLFAFLPLPPFWKFFCQLDHLSKRFKKSVQNNSLFYFFVPQVPIYLHTENPSLSMRQDVIKPFQRWFEWHFFLSSSEPDSEFDNWSIESYVDFEPSKTFSDLEDDVAQDFTTLFDDAWPEFTENDLDTEEEEENIMEEVTFEQDEDYSTEDTESEDKPAKQWKPEEEREENWLPWGDWVVFGKKFPEDNFLAALTWLLAILGGGVMLVLDNRDLLQEYGDVLMDYYTFFITKVSSWVFVGDFEWPWPSNWNFYLLDSSWGALQEMGWQTWSLTTDMELRLFDIHQFKHVYGYVSYAPVYINNFDQFVPIAGPKVADLANKEYSFLPGSLNLYFEIKALLALFSMPDFLNLQRFGTYRTEEEEKLFVASLENLTYFPRIGYLVLDYLTNLFYNFCEWFINWNPQTDAIKLAESSYVPKDKHEINPEFLLPRQKFLDCVFMPHFVQNYTWRSPETDVFLSLGPTWREVESSHMHEWAQENQYWDYELFWKNEAFSHIMQQQYPITMENLPAYLPHETRLRWLLRARTDVSSFSAIAESREATKQFLHAKSLGLINMQLPDTKVGRTFYLPGSVGPKSSKYKFIKSEPIWLWQSCNTTPPALRFSSIDTPILWPWHVSDNKLSGWSFHKDWDRLWDVNLHWYWGGINPENKSFFSKSYGDELLLRLPVLFNNYDSKGESVVYIPSEVIASKKFHHEVQWHNPFIADPIGNGIHEKMPYQQRAWSMYHALGGFEAAKQHREGRPWLRMLELDWFIDEGWGYPYYKGARTFVEIFAAEQLYTAMFSEFNIWTERYHYCDQINTNELYWPGRDSYWRWKLHDSRASDWVAPPNFTRTSYIAPTQEHHLAWRLLRDFYFLENYMPKTFMKSTPRWENSFSSSGDNQFWNFSSDTASHVFYPTSFVSRWSDLCADDFWSAHASDEDDLDGEDFDTPFESSIFLEPDDEDDEDELTFNNPWTLKDTAYRSYAAQQEARVRNGFLKNSEEGVVMELVRMLDEPEEVYTHEDHFMERESANKQDLFEEMTSFLHLAELRVEVGDDDDEQDYLEGDDVGVDELVGWKDLWGSLSNWYETKNDKTKNKKPFWLTVQDEKGGITFWPEERFWWPENFWSRDNSISFFGSSYWANLFDLSNWNQHLFVNRQSPNFNYVRPQAILLPSYDGWSFEVETTLDCFWTNMGCSSSAKGRRVAHGDENLYLEFWYKDPIVYVSPYGYPDYNDSFLPSNSTYDKYPAARLWGFKIPNTESTLPGFPTWGEFSFGRQTWGWWDYNRWGMLWWLNLDILLERDRVAESPEFWSYRSIDWFNSKTSSDAFFKAVGPRPFLSPSQHGLSAVSDKELTALWSSRLTPVSREYERVTVPKMKHFLKSTHDIYERAAGYLGQCIELSNRETYENLQRKYFPYEKQPFYPYMSISDQTEALRLLRVQSSQDLWFRNPWTETLAGIPGLETVRFDSNFQNFYTYPRPYYDNVLELKLRLGHTTQKLADGSSRPIPGLYLDDYEPRILSEKITNIDETAPSGFRSFFTNIKKYFTSSADPT